MVPHRDLSDYFSGAGRALGRFLGMEIVEGLVGEAEWWALLDKRKKPD
ncbi:MAG: hypothetical protein Q8P18_11250 [Pseudomonadota bacterium]|nr:hypothetical protein [Pseudomonadota bacterium]